MKYPPYIHVDEENRCITITGLKSNPNLYVLACVLDDIGRKKNMLPEKKADKQN